MSSPELHPVALRLCERLILTGEVYVLAEAARTTLEGELRAMIGDVDLRVAVRDLLKVACWLETEVQSPLPAQVILDVLMAMNPHLQALDDAESKSSAHLGQFAQATAPRVGAPTPVGTVKIGTLDYPKRG